MTTREGITCYEQDEILCDDGMCLRTGCRLRNERLASRQEVSVTVEELALRVAELQGNMNSTFEDDARALLAKYSITKREG